LRKGKCTPKCKESETYNEILNKCVGCAKGTKWDKKSKSCVKIVIPKCPRPTIRNKKTKKCDCPAGTIRDKKTKACVKIVHRTTCPKGYKKIAPNQCLKIVVKYTTVCPKGFRLKNGKCYKHTVVIKYENPEPVPEESRIECIMRYAKTVKELSTSKAQLNWQYTKNLQDNKDNTETQKSLDKVNLLIETWVQGINDCGKAEWNFKFKSSLAISAVNDIYMCGNFTCTKSNYKIWKTLIKEQWLRIVKIRKTSLLKISQLKAQYKIIATKKKTLEKRWMNVIMKKKEVYMKIYKISKLKNIAKAKCIKSKNTDKKINRPSQTIRQDY
jgi:hypothetical protein